MALWKNYKIYKNYKNYKIIEKKILLHIKGGSEVGSGFVCRYQFADFWLYDYLNFRLEISTLNYKYLCLAFSNSIQVFSLLCS